MIPVTATDEQQAQYVANILDVWERATRSQLREGKAWYKTAHALADMVSGGNPRAGAGVIAALSANKRWSENQRLAARCYAGDFGGHFPDALAKVEAIMAGADPQDVLPMNVKTGNFFRCIADPSDPEPVVVDRHAHDLAVGERYGERNRGLSSVKRYATLAHAYREAARKLGVIPSVVQAVTWTVWKDE